MDETNIFSKVKNKRAVAQGPIQKYLKI